VIGDAIYTLLNVADITDVVTGGIHHTVAPQDTPNPCIVINERGVNENYKNNSQIINHSLTIDVYCDKGKNGAGGFELANEIAVLVNSKLNRFSGIVGTKQIDTIYKVGSDTLYDSISESARVILEYNVRENEESGLADPLTYPLDIDIFEDDVFSRTESVSGFTGTLDLRLFANLKATVTGQEVIIKPIFLLDNFSGSPAAFSLRKLSGCAAKAIRVRRSSDDIELDIGFSGNDLDTSALETFCGVGDGFVVTWYDQSGFGNDATNAAELAQPQIVNSGSTLTENGKPTIKFDGTNTSLRVADQTILNANNNPSAFGVVSSVSTKIQQYIFSNRSSPESRFGFGYSYFSGSRRFTSASFNGISWDIWEEFIDTTGGQRLFSWFHKNFDMYIDATKSTGALNGLFTNINNAMYIGANVSGGNQLDGNIQELVFYNSDKTSDRTGIETNINDYYGVY
jgi:hypothetical protein